MGVKNNIEVFEAIDYNLKSHFEFDNETNIYCFDAVNERSFKFKLPDNIITELNEFHPSERGMILYEYVIENS